MTFVDSYSVGTVTIGDYCSRNCCGLACNCYYYVHSYSWNSRQSCSAARFADDLRDSDGCWRGGRCRLVCSMCNSDDGSCSRIWTWAPAIGSLDPPALSSVLSSSLSPPVPLFPYVVVSRPHPRLTSTRTSFSDSEQVFGKRVTSTACGLRSTAGRVGGSDWDSCDYFTNGSSQLPCLSPDGTLVGSQWFAMPTRRFIRGTYHSF